MSDWNSLQERIDSCDECKKLGCGLIVSSKTPPSRPPCPKGGEILFISEAPSREGGFWASPSVKDGLREKLFEILRKKNIPLPEPHTKSSLVAFASQNFFLIQTIKWPLRQSARTLRTAECCLIKHSVASHITQELKIIRPSAIIPLGKVACYACGCLFRTHGFAFDRRARLEDVRGKSFSVEIGHGCIPVYPTGLPVPRRAKHIPQICKEIKNALENHWHSK